MTIAMSYAQKEKKNSISRKLLILLYKVRPGLNSGFPERFGGFNRLAVQSWMLFIFRHCVFQYRTTEATRSSDHLNLLSS